jgi:hypothetical protein
VQLAFPGRLLLTDVVVSHTLTAQYIANRVTSVVQKERLKDNTREWLHALAPSS